jgi:hypothetical protein
MEEQRRSVDVWVKSIGIIIVSVTITVSFALTVSVAIPIAIAIVLPLPLLVDCCLCPAVDPQSNLEKQHDKKGAC